MSSYPEWSLLTKINRILFCFIKWGTVPIEQKLDFNGPMYFTETQWEQSTLKTGLIIHCNCHFNDTEEFNKLRNFQFIMYNADAASIWAPFYDEQLKQFIEILYWWIEVLF